MTATAARLSIAQQIEQRFHLGEPLEPIAACGDWTLDDVNAVLRDRGWDLDASGRLPRSKRITSPSGLRFLPAEAMRAPVQAVPPPVPAAVKPPPPPVPRPAAARSTGLKRPGPKPRPIPHGSTAGFFAHYRRKELPVCEACQQAYDDDRAAKKAAKQARTAAEVVAAGSRQMAVQCDTWFAEAQRSPNRRVRTAAAGAIGALLQLRAAMDELARAERAAGGRG